MDSIQNSSGKPNRQAKRAIGKPNHKAKDNLDRQIASAKVNFKKPEQRLSKYGQEEEESRN